jgi:hypothetical protein
MNSNRISNKGRNIKYKKVIRKLKTLSEIKEIIRKVKVNNKKIDEMIRKYKRLPEN